jgi:hypothetical protein
MKWKKDNKLPNTKNVKKKNPDGSVQVTPGAGKKRRQQKTTATANHPKRGKNGNV